MTLPVQPIYLFADSSLLFWKENGKLLLDSVRDMLPEVSPKAAYIGASNGDDPDFYSIFCASMESIGINRLRMIPSSFKADDAAFLGEADLILLAGGDVERGWNVFAKNGLAEIIRTRYAEGALLMGVSAGAVQLGLFGWPEAGPSSDNLIETFKLVPFIISAHQERDDWEELKKAIRLVGPHIQGIGIPSGGGLIYHADQSITPLRHPLSEFVTRGEEINHYLLFQTAPDLVESSQVH